jgi:exodeoxyribonuclease VII large subunit
MLEVRSKPPAPDRVYSVSRLNREARLLLEQRLAVVWVEGELSNFTQHSSGHWYFSLKDRNAQIRCAMFRQRNVTVGFTPRAGQHVLVRGRVSLYEPRGDYQLIAEHLEEAGVGALKREFERLKTKLAAEGLFAPERKRPLPRFPRRIGVITSPTGAAVRDVLHILARRFPPAAVLIYPTPVQGAAAAPALVQALALASARAECDVLILARGGGSLEDLWAFNDERVARAIHSATIPVVAGIGHEIDFTIADFVADARAPTPSGAAELVTPDRAACLEALARTAQRLAVATRRELRAAMQLLENAGAHLKLVHPGIRLEQQAQRLDDLEQRLARSARHELRAVGSRLEGAGNRLRLAHPGMRVLQSSQRLADLGRRLGAAIRDRMHVERNRLHETRAGLVHHSPEHRVREYRAREAALAVRLTHAGRELLERATHRMSLAARALDAVSPLATLKRGFAIVTRADGTVVTDSATVAPGDEIEARLARGRLRARVTGKE